MASISQTYFKLKRHMVSWCEKAVGAAHSLSSSVTVTLYQLLEDSRFSHCFLIEPELWVPCTMAPQGFLFQWVKFVCTVQG